MPRKSHMKDPLDDIEAMLASICNDDQLQPEQPFQSDAVDFDSNLHELNKVFGSPSANSATSKSPCRQPSLHDWDSILLSSPEKMPKTTKKTRKPPRKEKAPSSKKKRKNLSSSKARPKKSAPPKKSSSRKTRKAPGKVGFARTSPNSTNGSRSTKRETLNCSDDVENNIFLERMKTLAQEKLMVSAAATNIGWHRPF